MGRVGKLVVVEGLDGAGKRTLTDALRAEMVRRGARVTGLAFPRYAEDIHAELVRDALHGRLGDLGDSVHGMALLYALDRRAAVTEIEKARADNDVVLLDRYVASNAAYGAARLHEDSHGEFVRWVRAMEIDRFGIPAPDLHLLLRVSVDLAAERAAAREQADPSRARDLFESDGGLQARCAVVYEQLAVDGWLAPWRVCDGAAGTDTNALTDALLA
jgi:dTMP kinase